MNCHDPTGLDNLVGDINESPHDLVRGIGTIIKIQLHMVYPSLEKRLAVVERIIQPDDDLDVMFLKVFKAILERRWQLALQSEFALLDSFCG